MTDEAGTGRSQSSKAQDRKRPPPEPPRAAAAKRSRVMRGQLHGQPQQKSVQDFVDSLSTDAFTPDEEALCNELLGLLRERADPPPAVWELESSKFNPTIHKLCITLLPDGVGLDDWVKNRIDNDVKVIWDPRRECNVLRLADSAADAGPEERDPLFDLASRDEFSAAEVSLREALFDFLSEYDVAHPGLPPLLTEALENSDVNACLDLLPHDVGLGEWINARIGGEINVQHDDNLGSALIVRV